MSKLIIVLVTKGMSPSQVDAKVIDVTVNGLSKAEAVDHAEWLSIIYGMDVLKVEELQ